MKQINKPNLVSVLKTTIKLPIPDGQRTLPNCANLTSHLGKWIRAQYTISWSKTAFIRTKLLHINNKQSNCNAPHQFLHRHLCRQTRGTWRSHREFVLHCSQWSITSLRSRVAIMHYTLSPASRQTKVPKPLSYDIMEDETDKQHQNKL